MSQQAAKDPTEMTAAARPCSSAIACLRSVGLRPTKQRIALARLLFGQGDRHVTADSVHQEAEAQGIKLALATVYNTLHQFTAAGLLREVTVEPGRSIFDTNIQPHHHFYFEESGKLMDITADQVAVAALPSLPAGYDLSRVDVIVRLRPLA